MNTGAGNGVAIGRRGFLGLGAAAAASVFMPVLKADICADLRGDASSARFDDNLVAFLADIHAGADKKCSVARRKFKETVDEILAMRPLPRNVLVFGDIAYRCGLGEDYDFSRPLFRKLEDAGIAVTIGMGNHDRRENFWACFPEQKAKSLLDDRCVYVVETPRADFIVLDSLQQGEDTTTWITPGALDDRQRAWLGDRLSKYTGKPVLVMAHHPIHETLVRDLLLDSPSCCGYIHGHDHVWQTGWQRKNYSEYSLLPTLCVPSTGHWGDIGYTLLKMGNDSATASLREFEFFFPHPVEKGEARPPQWARIEQAHKDASWTFTYK